MSPGIKRWILRTIHIVFSIPIFGYIYSPFEDPRLCDAYPVCFRSYPCPFGALDVERACHWTTFFEEIRGKNSAGEQS